MANYGARWLIMKQDSYGARWLAMEQDGGYDFFLCNARRKSIGYSLASYEYTLSASRLDLSPFKTSFYSRARDL